MTDFVERWEKIELSKREMQKPLYCFFATAYMLQAIYTSMTISPKTLRKRTFAFMKTKEQYQHLSSAELNGKISPSLRALRENGFIGYIAMGNKLFLFDKGKCLLEELQMFITADRIEGDDTGYLSFFTSFP